MGELDRYTEASRARAAAQAAAAAERAAGDMLRYRLATEGIPIDEIPGLFHTARTLKNFSYTCYSAGVPQHRPYLGSKKPIFFGKERFIYGAEIGWGVAYGKERVYQGMDDYGHDEYNFLFIDPANVVRVPSPGDTMPAFDRDIMLQSMGNTIASLGLTELESPA